MHIQQVLFHYSFNPIQVKPSSNIACTERGVYKNMHEDFTKLTEAELITELQHLETAYAELLECDSETSVLESVWKKIKICREELEKRNKL